MPLDKYHRKRDFHCSPEPASHGNAPSHSGWQYVVQKHHARHLHYDLRLELDGVLKSWAVPKGPSLDPSVKRLAVHVEDHPIEYARFEGVIPPGTYGAGTVIVWDHGTWEPVGAETDYKRGKLKFRLHGYKLRGDWMLVRMSSANGETADNWLLIKERDAAARSEAEFDPLAEWPASTLSGRTIEEVSDNSDQETASRPVEEKQTPKPRVTLDLRLPGAHKAQMPRSVKPQLARRAMRVPDTNRWLHEIKLDGYRLVCHKSSHGVRLLTRRGQDWTDRFRHIAEAVAALPVERAILDGEIVALRSDGVSSFQLLQNAFRSGRDSRLVYFLFDVLYLDGFDLRDVTLERRKGILADVLSDTPGQLQFCDHLVGNGPAFLHECCERGLEGMISKRRDRPHHSGRSDEWLKSKCVRREEFVIGGFTDPAGTRVGLGALLLGYHDSDNRLIYAGRVGTGFSEIVLGELRHRLDGLIRSRTPFDALPEDDPLVNVHWTNPDLVAQVEFAGWTDAGLLRHASFQGLREDVASSEVVHSKPESDIEPEHPHRRRSAVAHSTAYGKKVSSEVLSELADIRLTHPGRVLYPDNGITKLDLVRYYVCIADWILPHVVDRPLSLVRCPDGLSGKCFFQKHPVRGMPDSIGRQSLPDEREEDKSLFIRDLKGLINLVQFSALELHPWGSRIDRPDRPDRMVFDLDPDESLPWSRVVAAARELHERLERLGLASFVKTTGGKGLHVIVPIVRRHPWEDIKAFSRAVADQMTADNPRDFTVNMSKAARTEKVFIDVNRNTRGATSVAAYSPRARPGAPVSVPLDWDELSERIRDNQYDIRTVVPRLAGLKVDPWEELGELRQSITVRMRRHVTARKGRQ